MNPALKNYNRSVWDFLHTARRAFATVATHTGATAIRGRRNVTGHTGATRPVAALAGLFIALALATAPVQAADVRDPIMREDLALVAQQLERIEQVIDRLAARQRRTDRRVILDVWQLRADINAIQAGIRDYLSPPRLPPRQLPPLSGDYFDQRSGGSHEHVR